MVDGWFTVGARTGDRTLEQQLNGLQPLLEEVSGKTVLDVGCAEGLISMALVERGAQWVHGIEIVPGHVDVAFSLSNSLACTFEVGDANEYEPRENYDIVLLLAVLHKLRDPSEACARLVSTCRELAVVRLPPANAPYIIDARSGYVRHNIDTVLRRCGFDGEGVTCGHLQEWTGYYRRRNG